MIVDDEESIHHSLKRSFHHEPYQLIFADSGIEGLKLVVEIPLVAVIISDQQMPGMNGCEFLARSREHAPDAIRMLLTGYSDIESTVASINEGGVTHYINKPWEDSTLLRTVRDGIKHYHLLQENLRQQMVINQQNESLRDALHCLKEKSKALEYLANMDPLTELFNRRRLFECLENEILRKQRYGGSLSVLLFDIDHFKLVNDTWGHATGDSVLRKIAQVTKVFLRKTDTAARYGGEEFVILLPESGLEGAFLIANRLLQLVANTSTTQEHGPQINVTISIGVAALGPNESAEELLKRADQAMYCAKNNGRNRAEVSTDTTMNKPCD